MRVVCFTLLNVLFALSNLASAQQERPLGKWNGYDWNNLTSTGCEQAKSIFIVSLYNLGNYQAELLDSTYFVNDLDRTVADITKATYKATVGQAVDGLDTFYKD